ncbi:MAG: hypothetical protein IGS54_15620 [Elainella sp. C42_A2020_010]|nr:hypothetical protein [Elainella sp. C42_A2020_010]
MGMFDYFVGSLRCPVCQNISRADSSTNMQTKLCNKPSLDELGVGHKLSINQQIAEAAGYLTVQQPNPDEAIHILNTWECPFCGTPYNWAQITVQNEMIEEVLAVAKSREVLSQVHFVSEECLISLAEALRMPYNNLRRYELIPALIKQV